MTDTVSVGADIEAQCGRCHDATVHKIVTVEKGRPKRALCTVCNAEHLYRRPKGPEPARGTGKRAGGARKKDDSVAAFEKALKAAPEEEPVEYDITGRFQEGQRLRHKTFGEGVVLKVLRPQVAEVIFRDGVRKMAMGH
jgi:hypothetical protein